MPTAGDEGYEKLVQCPYDRAHEIRKGRMQFHLEKCRKNFPLSTNEFCPYNKSHVVPKMELPYHMEEECDSRATWDRFTHENSTAECPVKDLVPVNAATVPDGDENWDNFEATGSVLNHIRAEAESKPIYRLCQVASKATRKEFRKQEQKRHAELAKAAKGKNPGVLDTASGSTASTHKDPLPRPRIQPNKFLIHKQDPSKAVAAIEQFKNLDLNTKPSSSNTAPAAKTSSSAASDFEVASSSRQMPFSYAAASGREPNRPPSSVSEFSMGNSSNSMMTALNEHWAPINNSRPSTAMSNTTSGSYATASYGGMSNRPTSAMSNASVGNSSITSASALTHHRPPNSAAPRQSTAMSIAASAALYNRNTADDDGFCQIPIPGLGRGRRKPVQ